MKKTFLILFFFVSCTFLYAQDSSKCSIDEVINYDKKFDTIKWCKPLLDIKKIPQGDFPKINEGLEMILSGTVRINKTGKLDLINYSSKARNRVSYQRRMTKLLNKYFKNWSPSIDKNTAKEIVSELNFYTSFTNKIITLYFYASNNYLIYSTKISPN